MQHGLYYPIVINQNGDVLDGHTRLKICRERGIEPTFVNKTFDNELLEKKFEIECNLRRHFTDFLNAELAIKLEPVEHELALQRMSISGKGGFTRNSSKVAPFDATFTEEEKGKAT